MNRPSLRDLNREHPFVTFKTEQDHPDKLQDSLLQRLAFRAATHRPASRTPIAIMKSPARGFARALVQACRSAKITRSQRLRKTTACSVQPSLPQTNSMITAFASIDSATTPLHAPNRPPRGCQIVPLHAPNRPPRGCQIVQSVTSKTKQRCIKALLSTSDAVLVRRLVWRQQSRESSRRGRK
jgi:hypothetical protein